MDDKTKNQDQPDKKHDAAEKHGHFINQGNDRTGGHTDHDGLPNNPAENAEKKAPEEEEEN